MHSLTKTASTKVQGLTGTTKDASIVVEALVTILPLSPDLPQRDHP